MSSSSDNRPPEEDDGIPEAPPLESSTKSFASVRSTSSNVPLVIYPARKQALASGGGLAEGTNNKNNNDDGGSNGTEEGNGDDTPPSPPPDNLHSIVDQGEGSNTGAKQKKSAHKPKIVRNATASIVLLFLSAFSFFTALFRFVVAIKILTRIRKSTQVIPSTSIHALNVTVIYYGHSEPEAWIKAALGILSLLRTAFYSACTLSQSILTRSNTRETVFYPSVAIEALAVGLHFGVNELRYGVITSMLTLLVMMGMSLKDADDTLLEMLFRPYIEIRKQPPFYHVLPPFRHTF